MNFKGLDIDSFAKFLYENKCFKTGDFTLKSGIKSPYYLDLRGAICDPKISSDISNALCRLDNNYYGSSILTCGIPYSGIPLATQYSILKKYRMIIMRKERKKYGTGRLIEGIYNKNDSVILIEDVISTGKSVIEVIEQIEAEGLKILKIFVVVDREMGGVEMLRKKGYKVNTLIKITDLFLKMFMLKYIDNSIFSKCLMFNSYSQYVDGSIPFNEKDIQSEIGKNIVKLMLNKKSNLCLSADVSTKEELLNVADQCGPYITVLKTHIDTLNDVNDDFLKKLIELSKKHSFYIFEDRKLCDIGNTVKKQANLISNWADIVNMHSLAGEKSVKSIDANIGLLLVGELSCEGNLIDYQYVTKTVDIARKSRDKVFGFISQKAIGGKDFLHFTPGVKFNTSGDGMGQKYKTPEEAIEDGADLIIVGRGILEADNIVEECKRYKEAGWNGYLKKLI
jgi:uridine monophosphate synthetase